MATQTTRQLMQSWLDAPNYGGGEQPDDGGVSAGNKAIAQEWMRLAGLYGDDAASQMLAEKGGGSTLGNTIFDGVILAAGGAMLGGAGAAAYGGGAGAAGGTAAGSLEMAPAWTAADTAAAGGTAAGGAAVTAAPPAAGAAGAQTASAPAFTATQAAAMPVAELGMVANPATAATATAGGIPEAMVGAGSGGAGAISLGTGAGGSTDYMKLAGQVLPSLIGAYGSNEQRKSQEQLAAEYRAMGAPYRDRLAALYANPNGFLTSPEVTVPVQQGTDSLARALSVRGNPAGSGTALQEIQNYSANQLFGKLGQEKDRLAGFGGLSFYNQAAPGASQAAITAQGQVYGDIGYGVGNVMNPQQYNNNQSLAAILKAYNISQGLS